MKQLKRKSSKKQQLPSRITNETVAEHRERILAGGRRFKYPMQYSRHKLVFNAVIIGVVSLVLLVGIIWWLLYFAQNTSNVMYRITRAVPVPVAKVKGQFVPYSDYLTYYRSSMHYLVNKERQEFDGKSMQNQKDIIKRQSFNRAVRDSYAQKLANSRDITVSDADIDAFLKQQRQLSGNTVSQRTYNGVIMDYYGWTPNEYRSVLRNQLIRQKVSFAVDQPAKQLANDIAKRLPVKGDEFKNLPDMVKPVKGVSPTYGASGSVEIGKQKDGGLSNAALKLEPGEISEAIEPTGGEGYYFVRLLEKDDKMVSYDYIEVPLTVFTKRLDKIQDSGQVTQYIDVPSAKPHNK